MSKKLFSFRLSENLMEMVKAEAESLGISTTELVHRYLRNGLNGSSKDDDITLATLLSQKLLQQNVSTIESQQIKELKKFIEKIDKKLDQVIP